MIDQYARRIAAVKDEADSTKVTGDLARDLAADERLIPGLLGHPKREVREWMMGTVVELLGVGAGPLLLGAYRRDPDPDIRSDALRQLIHLDPRLADSLKPALRKQLRSTDFFEPEDAMWALLDVRDTDAEPEIQAIAASRSDGLGLIAGIVAQGLRGEHGVIADRLLAHDEHYLTNWLARTAASLGTADLRDALIEAAHGLPDDECRADCGRWLARLDGSDT